MNGAVPSPIDVSIILVLLGGLGCAANIPEEAASSAEGAASSQSREESPPSYDSALAARLGADEYGMRTYVVAFLKAGPRRVTDPTALQELQRAHLDSRFRLADEGKLLLQGPFMDDGTLRGFSIYNVTSLEEARALAETDPAVQVGHLEIELHPWYGSAALQEVYGIHRRIRQRNP